MTPATRTLIALVALQAATTAPAAGAENELDASVGRGQAVAQRVCSRCHAIGVAGESPDKRAPPFRTLTYDLAAKHEWGGGATVGVGYRMTRFALLPAAFLGT